jgi:Outer membrane protein beta-barrel domain
VADVKLNGVSFKSVKTKQSLNYLEIPIMFKYRFGSDDFGLFLAAGPYFSFALSGTLTESYTNATVTTTSKTEVSFGDKVVDTYTSKDLGFCFGFGGYFSVGENSKLILDARFVNGATNILNDKNKTKRIIENAAFEVKNRSLQVSIGYLFTLEPPH